MSRTRETAIAAAGLAALAAAMGIGRFAFTPLLPMMQAQHGITLAQGSWLASANYLGYFAGALLGAKSPSARFAIRAALVTIALATAAMAFTSALALWLALRFAAGAASAWALVHVSSWCLAVLSASTRPLNGVIFAGVGIGIAAAGIACLALMAAGASATHAWLALGVAAAAVAAAVWPVLGGGDISSGKKPPAGFRWSADAIRMVVCYGALGFGYIIPATFVPAMAKAVVQDPRIFGWAWPLFGLTAAGSTLLAARARLISHRALWRLAAVAMAFGVASPVLFGGTAGILLAALLVGGTFMVITMAGLQEARRVAKAGASVLISAMTAAFAAGQIIGPLTVPLFAPRAGFSAALVLASTVLAASAVLLPKEKT